MRKLRHHEQKLLKKVDFIKWNTDDNLFRLKLMRKFHIQKREDLSKYNKLTKNILDLAKKIKEMDSKDPFRASATAQLLEKLYAMGLVPTKANLSLVQKISAATFCRRRLPVVMVKAHMAQTVKAATKFVQQGHVRLGPEVVTDPAFLVTRNLEDFLTWTDTSAIRKHVMAYNDERDDFDLMAS
ncbi:U3 small nucleolar ribonucleoprotein protein IMP3-like [Pomacea canaliculata]|uniref:U3 small nucleolar ribonucleoprotein protein IMP3-like n=1 Tax=Pomacea canaliculata TaxID=400727 RepID=UPI000D7285B1|nr:U3 small nucleolar ribonucleoprotein protein IMP3-like [Pomacea canaliculata]